LESDYNKFKKIPTLTYTWYCAAFYPKRFLLEGNINEKQGDDHNAIKTYEIVLDLWRDEDHVAATVYRII